MVTASAPPSLNSSMATSRSCRRRRSPGRRRRTGGRGGAGRGAGGEGAAEVGDAGATGANPIAAPALIGRRFGGRAMMHGVGSSVIGRTPGGLDIGAWIFKARPDMWDIGGWLASDEPAGSWRLADG